MDGPVAPVVRLNGAVVAAQEGGVYACALQEGGNEITVEAADTAGYTASRTFKALYLPPAANALAVQRLEADAFQKRTEYLRSPANEEQHRHGAAGDADYLPVQ